MEIMTTVFALAAFVFGTCTSELVTVQNKYANLTGLRDTANGVDVFIGVPYAQPPVGDFRLLAPKAIQKYQGQLNLSGQTSNACFGLNTDESQASLTTSEDCLTLDIVRPSTWKKPLPVYVFIHGGDFNFGDKSECDGRDLVMNSIRLDSPIIFVTLNYRLSFLGFPNVAHHDRNLGLFDQRLALEWVFANIADFGGNPEEIVLGGQNAGADSVAYMMMFEGVKTRSVFRGAIMQSGGATAASPVPYSNYTKFYDPYSMTVDLAGCSSAPDSFTCLQNVPIATLVAAYNAAYSKTGSARPSAVFMPIVDESFLEDYPSVLLSQGRFTVTPTLMGSTTNELVNSVPIYNGLGSDSAIINLNQQVYPYVNATILQQLLSYYPQANFKNIGPPLSGAEWSRQVAIQNDIEMFCPLYEQAIQMSATNCWKYRWNSVLQSAPVHQWEGVPQSSDLPYLFSTTNNSMVIKSAADLSLTLDFQEKIISFVTNLDPNTISGGSGVQWSKFTAKNQTRMVFQIPDATIGGLHMESEEVNEAACTYINSKNKEFLR